MTLGFSCNHCAGLRVASAGGMRPMSRHESATSQVRGPYATK